MQPEKEHRHDAASGSTGFGSVRRTKTTAFSEGNPMKKLLVAAVLAAVSGAALASLPVMPASNQQALLNSSDPGLAKNKRIAYDFFRIVLRGLRLDQAPNFMHESYMQHNPNADTGLSGFVDYFEGVLERAGGTPPPIPETLPGLVAIQAEGAYVTLSFVRECGKGADAYSTTWFDMFRIEGDKIAEHWDSALMGGGTDC
jgi:predicted SnoaL-like aldol condensation-catalyzing enzyme